MGRGQALAIDISRSEPGKIISVRFLSLLPLRPPPPPPLALQANTKRFAEDILQGREGPYPCLHWAEGMEHFSASRWTHFGVCISHLLAQSLAEG